MSREQQLALLPPFLIGLTLTASYVVYLVVGVTASSAPLAIFEITIVTSLLLTLSMKRKMSRVVRDHGFLLVLLVLLIICVLVAALIDGVEGKLLRINLIRNMALGVFFFLVLLAWIPDQKVVDDALRLILLGSLFALLYGAKQLIFGYEDFEIRRLAIMGSSLEEYNRFNTVRLTSSFGDPLLNSTMCVIGIFAFLISAKRGLLRGIPRTLKILFVLGLLISAVMTLARAPLFGLLVGLLAYFSMTSLSNINVKKIFKFIFWSSSGFVLILASINALENQDQGLSAKDRGMIQGAFQSASSLLFLFSSGDDMSEQQFISRVQSRGHRLSALEKAKDTILENPLGLGLSAQSKFSSSLMDIGFLRYGVLLGVLGLTAIFLLFLTILVTSFFNVLGTQEREKREEAILLFCLLVSMFVTQGISDIMSNLPIACAIWFFSAIIMDRRIALNGSSSPER